MLSNSILLITSILGFLSTALILIKNKSKGNSLINKYLIIITANVAIRFLFHWISESYPAMHLGKLITIIDVSFVMLIPCYYLYFQNIIYERKFELFNLFHFIVPSILGGLFIVNSFTQSDMTDLYLNLFFALAILIYIFYAIRGFLLLYKHVWSRKTQIKIIQKQNDQIKNWSLFLYFSFIYNLYFQVIISSSLSDSS
jgi:hypothetical protein